MKISSQKEIENQIAKPYILRAIHEELFKSLEQEEVSVLYGPRQVGKSCEIALCIYELLKHDPWADIFYYNLDIIAEDFSSPDNFLNSLFAQKSDKRKKTYIFIDEAQRLENIGLFVKYIYDQKRNIKFFLTGSASLDIKTKIKEPLTGRKKEFALRPLTLSEIMAWHGFHVKNIEGNFSALEKTLEDYLLFGGYPGVLTSPNLKAKKEKLEEISQSYVLRDVAALFEIGNITALNSIAIFLAENIGNLVSKDNISRLAAVSKYETEKILSALEKTFIFWYVRPFAKNRTKEIIHRPKIYFLDTGIRNALLRKLDPALVTADRGKLFENAVANQLAAHYQPQYVKFWRTINQTEVDFIAEKEGGKLDVWEAKYSWNQTTIPRNIASFLSSYKNFVDKSEIVSKQTLSKLLFLP
ncbi:MAG: ATP-binding protein [bacterium]